MRNMSENYNKDALMQIFKNIFHTENIAKNKSAKQENPYETSGLSELGQASRAFDGLKSNLSAFGGQCTLSANHKKEALLYVDLATILGFHHITVYYRTDNLQWGKNDLSLLPAKNIFADKTIFLQSTTSIDCC